MPTIKVFLPTGLPDPSGKPAFRAEEFLRESATIAVLLDALALDDSAVSHCVFRGEVIRGELPAAPTYASTRADLPRISTRRVFEYLRQVRAHARLTRDYTSNFERYTLRAGDELHVIPKVAGKNAAIILGVVGGVVGFFLGGPGLTIAAWHAAMIGFSVGSAVGSLLTPRPRISKSGDGGLTSYAWSGGSNDARSGVPVPLVFGRHKVFPARIGAFIRREGEKEKLYFLGLVSKGPIFAINDIRINGQPYANFPGVTVATRLGVAGQAVINGFNAIANTVAQNVDLTAGNTVYTTSAVQNIDAFELLITVPGLSHTDGKGQMVNNTTRYQYRYRVFGSGAGGWSAWFQRTLTRSTRATVFDTVRVESLAVNRYDIEVGFVSADNVDATKDQWKPFLTGVTEERQDTRTYDGYALLAIQAIATENLSGSIPEVSCVADGMLLEWFNGTSIQTATFTDGSGNEVARSPAWAILKLLRDPIIGLGRWIDDTKIDLQSFKTCADFNKTAVTVTPSVGAPYNEPRHLFDCVIDQQQTALDMLHDICSTARLVLVLSGNKWKLIPETTGAPVQLFTMGNIVEDSFQVNYQRDKSINALDAQFIDAQRDFSTTSVLVVSKPAVEIGGESVKSQPRALFGVTRESQAVRESRYDLNKRYYYRRIIRFIAATDAILMEAGDIFNFQHDLPQWGFGGQGQGRNVHVDHSRSGGDARAGDDVRSARPLRRRIAGSRRSPRDLRRRRHLHHTPHRDAVLAHSGCRRSVRVRSDGALCETVPLHRDSARRRSAARDHGDRIQRIRRRRLRDHRRSELLAAAELSRAAAAADVIRRRRGKGHTERRQRRLDAHRAVERSDADRRSGRDARRAAGAQL
jgi:predicted phage tail protein